MNVTASSFLIVSLNGNFDPEARSTGFGTGHLYDNVGELHYHVRAHVTSNLS